MTNQKTIKIKLNNSNPNKIAKLDVAYESCQNVAHDYLMMKKDELETKEYGSTTQRYADFRLKYPELNSALLQQVMRRCDSQVKSYISWCKKSHKLVEFNDSPRMPILLRDTNVKFSKTDKFDAWLSLWQVKYPLMLCDYHRKLFERSSKCLGSKIIKSKDGSYHLLLTLQFEHEEIQNGSTLGVDIGIAKPIVTSDGKHIGSGSYITHMKKEFGKKRAKNASLKQEIFNKQHRWTNDVNHKLSRELIDYALQQNINVLCLEKLKGCQLSGKKYRNYNWAFADLLTKIKYKAECEGIKVISVNPAHTSQTCSSCGSKAKANRKSQSLFICDECGAKMNADVNAAKNICGLSTTNGCNVSSAKSKSQLKIDEALNSEVSTFK